MSVRNDLWLLWLDVSFRVFLSFGVLKTSETSNALVERENFSLQVSGLSCAELTLCCVRSACCVYLVMVVKSIKRFGWKESSFKYI